MKEETAGMKGLELLKKSETYIVYTDYNQEGYKDHVFTGYLKENDDVTLACFDDVSSGWESFFDISIPSNRVELQQ